MTFEEELKVLQDWCIRESDKCLAMEPAKGSLDDRPCLEAKKVYREYNQKLLQLKEKYGITD